jgi:tetratricopeptide (TPR) repeat protein
MESPSMLLSSMLGRLRVWEQWNRNDEAREVAASILQISEQYQQPDKGWQLSALEVLAEVAYRAGKVEESEEFLRRYHDLHDHYCPSAPMLLPAIHAVHQNWVLALADMREIVRRAEPFPLPEALAHQAELAVLAGQPVEEQQEFCARAVRVGEESGARKYLAIALRARGRMQLELSNWDEAEKDLRRALTGFKELDLPWEQGETLACLGQLHCRLASQPASDQAARARHSGLASFFLQQALGFFEAQHAVHDVRRVREMLAGAQIGV